MDLSPFGFERRREAVVILGAGATRGVSYTSVSRVVRPPVDADFFAQLRASEIAQDLDAQRLLEFVDDEFGDTDISMEAFYSQVHLHDQFVVDLPKGKGRRRRYQWARQYFMRVIPRLLEVSVGRERCAYHDALVSALTPGDAILSFNYDCVIDESLRDVGLRNWDPTQGYGVPATGAVDDWRNHSGTGRFPKRPLRLLKLHGSLNWWVEPRGGLELLLDPYLNRDADQFCIVPPLWQKSFDRAPFHEIWIDARSRLTTTKALLLVGYSLPLTDVYTQALLRIDVQALDFLLIANPDAEARTRIKRALRSALTTSTRIVELETMCDVGTLLR